MLNRREACDCCPTTGSVGHVGRAVKRTRIKA